MVVEELLGLVGKVESTSGAGGVLEGRVARRSPGELPEACGPTRAEKEDAGR